MTTTLVDTSEQTAIKLVLKHLHNAECYGFAFLVKEMLYCSPRCRGVPEEQETVKDQIKINII